MTPNTNPELHAYFSELGKRGKAKQTANSTPEQRTERARHAAQARWAKQNEARAEQFKRENEKANMETTLTIQDVLEIHRITCAEQDCSPGEITGPVAIMAADQVAESNPELGAWLKARAEEMDRPVALWQIKSSLEQHGLR